MPFALRDNVRIYWRQEGSADRPPLLLLNSIATDMSLWDRVMPYLLPRFRVLRLDGRGHGASDAPAGDYSLGELALDAIAVMDAARVDRTAIAGVSLGGMVAMELALQAPERVAALALICTSAKMDRASWVSRVETVRSQGTAAIADIVMRRFLSTAFTAMHRETAATIRQNILQMNDNGYAGAGAAIRDMDLIERIAGIRAPTLVISGSADVSTPAAGHGDRIVALVDGAENLELACAHLPPIENPGRLASALVQFFGRNSDLVTAKELLTADGMANRRRILGDEWVDKSIAGRTDFNSEFQDFITRIAWHEIWGRPGLDERTRRLLVIAITAALGRWEEFRLHVRAGLELGGFTEDEIKETLLQLAIYAGVPAANTGFAEASEILKTRHESAGNASA